VEIITAADLASWLRNPALATDPSLTQIVGLTNDLITEKWTDPEDPPPVEVTLLALSVGARAWAYDPAASAVESRSVRIDDGATTDRFRSPSHGGVYLTSDEVAALNGESRQRSIRLVTYGEV
jgi:hypothetical protein